MISPHRILWVKAIDIAHVRELDSDGNIFRTGQLRYVGKQYDPETKTYQVIPEGQKVQYHSHYLKCLKEGTLLAADQETAAACGVPFNSNKDN